MDNNNHYFSLQLPANIPNNNIMLAHHYIRYRDMYHGYAKSLLFQRVNGRGYTTHDG